MVAIDGRDDEAAGQRGVGGKRCQTPGLDRQVEAAAQRVSQRRMTTVAPAALIQEIELQRNTKTNQKPPLLPSPWGK